MAASFTSFVESPLCCTKLKIKLPYSSASLSISVAKRQVARRESPSKSPRVTLVFPTSIARNIRFCGGPPSRLYEAEPGDETYREEGLLSELGKAAFSSPR